MQLPSERRKQQNMQDLQSRWNPQTRRGYVDTIIEPEDTRKYVIGAFEMLFTKERIVRTKNTVQYSEVRQMCRDGKNSSLMLVILILVLFSDSLW